MKLRFLFSVAMALAVFSACSQTSSGFPGSWEGKLPVGGGLRLVFHIKDNGAGRFQATADSPDQSAFGIKCDSVGISGNDIVIDMRVLNASFTGKLIGDSAIDGVFKQGVELPLVLKRAGEPGLPANKRPQEPRPPFPYRSEELTYSNAAGSIRYGATITIPEGAGPFPAALLITGSGAQNRDEEIMGHKPFAVLADALTRNGFVVLRVDDRGTGKTTGSFAGSTTADFAGDANTSLDFLLSRPEVDRKRVGLIGHSEGGMIAPMVAAKRKEVDFVILLAGPGVKISQLMADQNRAILRQSGIADPAVDSYISMYQAAYQAILAAKDSTAAIAGVEKEVREWAAATDPSLLKALSLDSPAARQKVAGALAQQLSGKWYRYFMAFDPAPYLQKLQCKVLAINGDKDIQVLARPNLAGIEAALKKSRSKTYTIGEMPGLNHLFQACRTCTVMEYGQLEETFSPQALEKINTWLNSQVK